jgi:hypothetical protein
MISEPPYVDVSPAYFLKYILCNNTNSPTRDKYDDACQIPDSLPSM